MNFQKLGILCSSVICVFTLFSCGGISERERISDDPIPSGDYVSRAQYEELRQKYEQLEMQISQRPQVSKTEQKQKELSSLAETVDVFSQAESQPQPQPRQDQLRDVVAPAVAATSTVASSRPSIHSGEMIHNYNDIDVDGLVERLRNAIEMTQREEYSRALSELRSLERAPIRQISARARFYIGELFFRQREYDLAMQAYEEVLRRDAFSGLVLSTLGRLIVCSENLNLESKKEQYHSLLHDFFEA